jgi:S-adenosylmethionine decarboxylase
MKKTKGSIRWAKRKNQKYLGIHLIAEFWGGKITEDSREIEKILKLAAKEAGNTPLEFSFHKFNPHGMTGVLLLAESHIAFHSWPEYDFVALDIFTCGPKTFPEKALEVLKKEMKPKKIKMKTLKRGRINV